MIEEDLFYVIKYFEEVEFLKMILNLRSYFYNVIE